MTKLIQKDITFEFDFIFPLFGFKKAVEDLKKKYDVETIATSWSLKKPLKVFVTARINIKHDVDIEAIRVKQHELNGGMING